MLFEHFLTSVRYRTAFLHRNFDEKALGILAKTEAKMPFQSLIFDEKPLGLSSSFLIIFEHLGDVPAGPRRRNFDGKPLGKPPNWLKSGSGPRGPHFDEKPLSRQRNLLIQERDSRHCISMKNDWKYSAISMLRL